MDWNLDEPTDERDARVSPEDQERDAQEEAEREAAEIDANSCVDCGEPAYVERDGAPVGETRCWDCGNREAEEFGL